MKNVLGHNFETHQKGHYKTVLSSDIIISTCTSFSTMSRNQFEAIQHAYHLVTTVTTRDLGEGFMYSSYMDTSRRKSSQFKAQNLGKLIKAYWCKWCRKLYQHIFVTCKYLQLKWKSWGTQNTKNLHQNHHCYNEFLCEMKEIKKTKLGT
jgi:hypothetical protein